MFKLWLFINRVVLYIWFKSRIPKLHTALYRFVYEREYIKTVQVPVISSLQELAGRLKPDWWRADGLRQLFDVVSSPSYVQWVWMTGPVKDGFDCDEFAVYITEAVNSSLQANTLSEPGLHKAWFTTVCWLKEDGKYEGHNVSALEYWSNGEISYRYMDYQMPSRPFKSLEELASGVVKDYGGHKTTIIVKQDVSLGVHELIFPRD